MKTIYQKIRYLVRARKYATRIDRVEIRILNKIIKRGEIAMDIGSHKGGYIYWMQKAVGPTGKVYSFEPQPEAYEYLKYIKEIFHFDQVEINNLAISDHEGVMSLYSPQSRVSTGATLVKDLFPENDSAHEVRVTTIDKFLEKLPDLSKLAFIKVDVETHEKEVFAGARKTLESARTFVQFEADQHIYGERPISEIFDLLKSFGLKGYFFSNYKLKDINQFDVSKHQSEELRNTPNHPDYSNNFLFCHPERTKELESYF